MPKNMKKSLNKPIKEMQLNSRIWARLRENYFTDGGSIQTANFQSFNMQKVIKIFKEELKIDSKQKDEKIKSLEKHIKDLNIKFYI